MEPEDLLLRLVVLVAVIYSVWFSWWWLLTGQLLKINIEFFIVLMLAVKYYLFLGVDSIYIYIYFISI